MIQDFLFKALEIWLNLALIFVCMFIFVALLMIFSAKAACKAQSNF